jgi:DUF1680 family protein
MQTTKLPFPTTVELAVSASQPVEYTLYIRIPLWTREPILAVNGRRVAEPLQPGTFAAIRRTWKEGDRVELELPMSLRLEPVDPQHLTCTLMRALAFAVAGSAFV